MENTSGEAVLEFVVGGSTYTLAVREIEQIVEVNKETVYPFLEEQDPLLGMLNIHGQVVTLVRFPYSESVKYKKNKITCVVVQLPESKFAFPIEQISHVQRHSTGQALTVAQLWKQICKEGKAS